MSERLTSVPLDAKRARLAALLQAGHDTAARPKFPALVQSPDARHDPFRLSDIQQAYWVGRNGFFALGNVACHGYLEFEGSDIDLPRLNVAFERLIVRHEMLRAIVEADGRQRVLPDPPRYEIGVTDLRARPSEEVAHALDAVRERMSRRAPRADEWPLFEIRAHRLDDDRVRLHGSFDLLVLDVGSLQILFREWGQLYRQPDAVLPPFEISFREYLHADQQFQTHDAFERSKAYWMARVANLPPGPELPLARTPESITQPRFVRRADALSEQQWTRLKRRASEAGLTGSGLLLAAYASVLGTWSKEPHYTINVTIGNRIPFHPQVFGLIGDFTSINLLAVDASQGCAFADLAPQVQHRLWTDLEHRYYNGVRVLRDWARSRGAAGSVMPVVFTSALPTHTGDRGGSPTEWLGDLVYGVSQTPQVWLDHQVYEDQGKLLLVWDGVEDLFPVGMLDDMFSAYGDLLRRLADDDGAWHSRCRGLAPARQIDARKTVNDTGGPAGTGLLHALVADHAVQQSDAVAVAGTDRRLTYAELDRRAAHLCDRLVQAGARPEIVIAISLEKGWRQVVAALAILRSGAAYVPVDPALPRERFQHLIEHSSASIAVTDAALDTRLPWPSNIRRLVVANEEVSGEPVRPADSAPHDLAYVIYTSGSTGLPKGVMIDHAGAANTIADINERFAVGPRDKVLAVSSLGFDLSVYDLFGLLSAGGAVVMPDPSAGTDPAHWARLLSREGVTIWNSVPALMTVLVEYLEARNETLPPALRLVLLSGDWIPVSLPERIRALAPHAELVSLGGATEASIWSILYPIAQVDRSWPSIPYGRPMRNQQFEVFNDAWEPCPVWVTGELYIGGSGLARGYWRDTARTAASFVVHPRTGKRFYRTGDLGRYLPSGDIEFLGRQDFQVKLQGYRIELGEIEATLRRHPAVRDAVAAVRTTARGDRQLAAFVTADDTAAPEARALRAFVSERLPAYMVPAAVLVVNAFPLTGNGKVDRRALADLLAPAPQAPDDAGAADSSDRLATITAIVTSLVGVPNILPDEDLANLGVTSLDMVRIANLLEAELGQRPNVADFYRDPTIAGLARFYTESAGAAAAPIERFAASSGAGVPPSPLTRTMALIVEPAEREAFKAGRPGLRPFADEPFVPLITSLDEAARAAVCRARRSRRQFDARPVSFEDLGGWLESLRALETGGQPKYLYPSAGALYPVQTYLHIKASRVEGLAPGTYSYDPSGHRLVSLTPDVELDRAIHEPFINRPIFDAAAFSVFLVAQLAAIVPLYGPHAWQLAVLEAGYLSQLLMMEAPKYGIGVCPIGDVVFDKVRGLFALDDTHALVHSLVGGRVND